MIKPYDGFIQDKGLSLISRKELIQIGEKALKSGISLAIHAIGDQANRDVIKAFEYFRSFEINQKLNPSVLRIEHLQLIDPVDIPRLAEFRIVASMQPIHAPSDAPMADRLWGKRVGTSYAWKSIYDAGAMLIFGSDCPVESPNPIWGIYAAVARKRHEPSANSWHPEQCVNFMQALEAYTHNPSIISNQGNDLGMLKQGYLADLVFLSKNPLTTHSNELYNIKIDDVMLAGKWILPGPLSS